MATYQELVAASQAVRDLLRTGVEGQLRAIPGVRHVSVGLKVRAGAVTPDLCIRVYVSAKRPESELAAAERIPRRIAGVPTDVNVSRVPRFTVDATTYRPLKGGSLIGNNIVDLNSTHTRTAMGRGTLGCTATRRDGTTVLLTNWHVLTRNGGKPGDPVWQPPETAIPSFDATDLPTTIGDRDQAVAVILDARITDKVDAGIAKLNVSSCCRCCGLDYRDEIVGLSQGGHPPSNNILGMRPAVAGATVYKVGARTGRTVGKVVDPTTGDLQGKLNGVAYTLTGQIEIASQNPDESFSDEGDSGSALIDDDGWIVGLLFGNADQPPNARSFANHIADVCAAMDITINLTQGHGTAGVTSTRARATFPVTTAPGGAELYVKARARVEADPAGRWLWALAEQHREEVVSLINTRRRVSVVWHRAGGPAMFAAALNALSAGEEFLPRPPDGATLEGAMARVGSALAAHGSERLRAALAAHRDALIDAARGSNTLGDFLERLRPHALVQVDVASPATAALSPPTGQPA
jgi:hypothetical protein